MSRLTQRSFDELPGSMPPTSKNEKRFDDFKIPKYAYEGMYYFDFYFLYADFFLLLLLLE